MSKKVKKAFCLAEDFQAVKDMIPKLESLIKIHKEIADGYNNYRKNGGKEISEIEKHLAIIEPSSEHCEKDKKIDKATKPEPAKESNEMKKSKKKDK